MQDLFHIYTCKQRSTDHALPRRKLLFGIVYLGNMLNRFEQVSAISNLVLPA